MESKFGRFWKYEFNKITLIPIDTNEPRMGGKVIVKGFHMNWQTMMPSIRTKYGIYGEDFIQYGEF